MGGLTWWSGGVLGVELQTAESACRPASSVSCRLGGVYLHQKERKMPVVVYYIVVIVLCCVVVGLDEDRVLFDPWHSSTAKSSPTAHQIGKTVRNQKMNLEHLLRNSDTGSRTRG